MNRWNARIGSLRLWAVFAALMLLAPKVFNSGLSVTMLSQMGVAIVACLSKVLI